MINSTIEVVGVKEALATLQALDKRTRRQITRDFATIAKPMVETAQNMMPNKPPMSGWAREYKPTGRYGRSGQPILPWEAGAELRMVKAFTSGKRKNAAIFGMKWNSATARLFDMSGKSRTPQGAQMVSVLGSRYGSPSRIMWKAYEQASLDVQHELRQLVEKIMNESSMALRSQSGVTRRIRTYEVAA